MFKKILCLDFDGVCSTYESGWHGADVINDPPVPGLFEFLDEARNSFDIQIFSSRSHQANGIAAMMKWFALYYTEYLFRIKPELKDTFSEFMCPDWLSFPTEKPPAFITLDDRALTFNGTWPEIDTLTLFQPWFKRQ